jgi:RNA polymerase sigma factor (sigma-70 family)
MKATIIYLANIDVLGVPMRHAFRIAPFPSTIWSQVVRAGNPASPEAHDALARLCQDYWEPIHALIRRRWHPAQDADDLTGDFFARLLERETLARVDRERGRFRDFLRNVCVNFLIDEHRWRLARVNGGGISCVSIDVRDSEGYRPFEPADFMTPDRQFERDWALALLKKVLDRLAQEYARSGKAQAFEHLKVVLTEGRGAVTGAELAARLGMTGRNAVAQASHRLRKRYRQILVEEIAATLNDPSEVDEEIKSLFDAIRS